MSDKSLVTLDIFAHGVDVYEGDFLIIQGEAGLGKSKILKECFRRFPDQCHFLIQTDKPVVWQNINILRVALENKNVYLFDEPTDVQMDREFRMETLRLIVDLHDQMKTIIMATHDPAAIELGTRIIELKEDKTFINHGVGLHHIRPYGRLDIT